MKFAEQGYRAAAVPAVLGLLCGFTLGWVLGFCLLLFALAVLLFFRDPERVTPDAPNCVIAPADGRVVRVDGGAKGHRLCPEARTKISIFMSPLDVHINRVPVDATVEAIEHRSGKFSAAYSDEASETNESNSLLLRAADGYDLVVVQIAGWLARRIVCYIDERAEMVRGQRFGLIMFGSRVDIFLPAGARPKVSVGQRTTAGDRYRGSRCRGRLIGSRQRLRREARHVSP